MISWCSSLKVTCYCLFKSQFYTSTVKHQAGILKKHFQKAQFSSVKTVSLVRMKGQNRVFKILFQIQPTQYGCTLNVSRHFFLWACIEFLFVSGTSVCQRMQSSFFLCDITRAVIRMRCDGQPLFMPHHVSLLSVCWSHVSMQDVKRDVVELKQRGSHI